MGYIYVLVKVVTILSTFARESHNELCTFCNIRKQKYQQLKVQCCIATFTQHCKIKLQ